MKSLSHFTHFGCRYDHFFIFLINHLRLHLLLLLGSTVLYLLHPPTPICRLSQSRRVKFESSICSWHCLLIGGCWSLCWIPVHRACFVCDFLPGTLLMPLWVQIPVLTTISGVFCTWPLILTCWASIFPECLGPEEFPVLTASCAKITLSLWNSIGPRIGSGSQIYISSFLRRSLLGSQSSFLARGLVRLACWVQQGLWRLACLLPNSSFITS